MEFITRDNCEDVKLFNPCFICLKSVFHSENGNQVVLLEFFLKYLNIIKEVSDTTLCELCKNILEKLSSLMIALEKVKLEMNYLVEVILKEILKSDDSKQSSEVSSVRESVLLKCHRKVRQSRPTVELKRLDPSLLVKKPSRTDQIKIEIDEGSSNLDSPDCYENQQDFEMKPLIKTDAEDPATPEVQKVIRMIKPEPGTSRTKSKVFSSGQQKRKNAIKLTNRKAKCNFCNLELPNFSHMERHRNIIHLKRFPCDLCGKLCGNRHLRDRHMEKCNPNPNPDGLEFVCGVCGKGYDAEDKMKSHKYKVHDKNRNHNCDICGKKFSLNFCLERHKAEKHGKSRFHCEVEGCDKSYCRILLLSNHYKEDHPNHENIHERPADDSDSDNFARVQGSGHFKEVGSKGELKIKCLKCVKRYFRNWRTCYDHFRDVHQPKKFKCVECDAAYASKRGLVLHFSMMHKKANKESNEGGEVKDLKTEDSMSN